MRALRIGLTGGTGAGKSLALREFARLGAKTVSSDSVARDVVRPGRLAHRKIAAAFGGSVLDAGGRLDRRKLAAKIFSSPRLRRRLERITHPEILREMERRLGAARPGTVAVADVPLLFEGRHQGRFDAAVFVSAPSALRIERIVRRDGLSRRQALSRMSAQWPEARKAALADVVIANAGNRKRFLAAVQEYYKAMALIASAGGGRRPR
ncbi:MAG: dephospho-CoA kinase [Elusimicrobia bacterium]|nr:dephospho-CoA kinase [Elusimicrobiota bacterium]MDE2313726.1 dephospho-CoA kinase [Elusimicrobiota bacterium]